MIQGRGGRSGPDLSSIGSSRNPQHLRTSLLKPSEDFPIQWWTAYAKTRKASGTAACASTKTRTRSNYLMHNAI
jgi:hypothetical protein